MRMPCCRLARNDSENGSVFTSLFKSLLNNNQLNHDTLLSDIRQREVMVELDAPPKFKKAITELINDKVPGLNGVPSKAFKLMSDRHL